MMDAGAAFLDGRYLLNQADGMRFFYGWYLGDTELAFDDMLSMHHRLACLGITGNRVYLSWGGMGNSYLSDTRFPGMYREELRAKGQQPIDSDRLDLSPGEWRRLGFDETPAPRRFTPILEGIPEAHLGEATIAEADGKRVLLRTAPIGEAEASYRALAGRRMAALRGFRDWTARDVKKNLPLLLDALADYYHAAIHWMPFSSINNSLFMGHVNAILKHLELDPMPHGRLDYLALGSDGVPFRRLFRGHYDSSRRP